MAFEYFDVPYRYDETFIKLLFQNPFTLYVYWDISSEYEKELIKTYGEDNYYNSSLFLEVINMTDNTQFEIPIDPFSKSWYVNIDRPNCRYRANLCRRIHSEKKYIATSNLLAVPPSRPAVEQLKHFVFVHPKSMEVKYTEKQTIAMQKINTYSAGHITPEKIDADLKEKEIQSYILKNPTSLDNISSGSRYTSSRGGHDYGK